MTGADRLKKRLERVGLSESAIEAAWPAWWSDDADSSLSAQLELRFSVARKLGLDARSLVDEEGTPRFVWREEARFKNLSGESDLERAAIASFGRSVCSMLLGATSSGPALLKREVLEIRESILRTQPFVTLLDLLALSWAAGIPVAHLRVFPFTNKRMVAMSARVGEREAILLGKESRYPAQAAFYLAHEIGHIALGHLSSSLAIVDLNTDDRMLPVSDEEERQADEFALRLLTGRPQPEAVPTSSDYNAPGLASTVIRESSTLRIDPGTLALCFGYSTGNWAVVNSAMRFIYGEPRSVGSAINEIAAGQLLRDELTSDSVPFLNAVLGLELRS